MLKCDWNHKSNEFIKRIEYIGLLSFRCVVYVEYDIVGTMSGIWKR